MKQLSMDQLNRPARDEYLTSEKIPVVVVLDNVRSGLNVGAVFRTCDAFSIQRICLCGITVQPPHAEILKTALGSTESVRWTYFEKTLTAIAALKQEGFNPMPVEQTDQSLFLDEADLIDRMPLALIFGNEMRGISADVLAECERSIEIPQSGTKHSLNIATSAGIVLWECYRQFLLRRRFSSL